MTEEEKRRCPWCQKFITPQKDEEGDLFCPECRNYLKMKLGDHTVEVKRPETPAPQVSSTASSASAEAPAEAEDIIPASELGVDDELDVVSVEEARARCPFIIEKWEWRTSQFSDREFVSMQCVDSKKQRFIWNTSAWRVLRKLKAAERLGKKRIAVSKVEYDTQGGRPRNIRIR